MFIRMEVSERESLDFRSPYKQICNSNFRLARYPDTIIMEKPHPEIVSGKLHFRQLTLALKRNHGAE